MRRAVIGLVGISLAAGLAAGGGGLANAAPDEDMAPTVRTSEAAPVHDLPNPLEEKRRSLREEALKLVLNGQRKVQTINGSQVVKVGEKRAAYTRAERAKLRAGKRVRPRMVDQYVELRRERTDKIFVVLAEFGNTRATDIDPRYGDRDTDPDTPGPTTFNGPLHNEIPAPDRSKDNSTVWQRDYSADYYRKLYFGKGRGVESLKTYYEKQSSGRYSVEGKVTNWVKVKYNEARYGRSDGFPCAGNVCSNTWNLLDDALDQWVADQKAAGRTDAQIKADVASFDQWDRYDYNSDGNFNEPDGYLDHFQIVHAGGDQADGDPYQGEDAIWSHRWRAFQCTQLPCAGPANFPIGGTEVGNTGIWAADYTIQPENGGLSVFAHEYGHDLGLPDLYDTTGKGSDSTVGFWSLMAQSRLSARRDQGIGTRPGDLGAWEKLQLGWLDYEKALAGEKRTYRLGPHEYNSRRPQGLVVVLPKKQVTEQLVSPYAGSKTWWSGTDDDLNATMSRRVTLPAAPATLSFQTRYDIEDCGSDPCDYAYVEVDAGSGWTALPGNITKAAEGNAIEGTVTSWTAASFDLSAYAGREIGLRVRYTTDGAVAGNDPKVPDGIFIDAIRLTAGGATLLEDGAETSPNGWDLDGFSAVGSTRVLEYDNYYIASNREYVSYDRYLRTGPYNFGFANTRPDWVEHFPYQDGLLISYWDTSQANNDVGDHPGEGEILPIDAHPRPLVRLDGEFWRGRVALYDATFGRQRADSFTLHVNGRADYIRGQNAQPTFDDSRSYYDPRTPYTSVKVPNAGVTMTVTRERGTSVTVRLGTNKPVSPAATLASARAD